MTLSSARSALNVSSACRSLTWNPDTSPRDAFREIEAGFRAVMAVTWAEIADTEIPSAFNDALVRATQHRVDGYQALDAGTYAFTKAFADAPDDYFRRLPFVVLSALSEICRKGEHGENSRDTLSTFFKTRKLNVNSMAVAAKKYEQIVECLTKPKVYLEVFQGKPLPEPVPPAFYRVYSEQMELERAFGSIKDEDLFRLNERLEDVVAALKFFRANLPSGGKLCVAIVKLAQHLGPYPESARAVFQPFAEKELDGYSNNAALRKAAAKCLAACGVDR